jgi:hypothetical protein
MVEKIPPWERENDKKNSGMTVKIPAWERKNVFLCMETLVLRHPSYRPGFTFLFCISVVSFDKTFGLFT